jgi:hypothetical protein
MAQGLTTLTSSVRYLRVSAPQLIRDVCQRAADLREGMADPHDCRNEDNNRGGYERISRKNQTDAKHGP